jgi:DNA-binding NtrC family response regulator
VKSRILIVCDHQNEWIDLRNELKSNNYITDHARSLDEMTTFLKAMSFLTVIIDIDSIPVDNLIIRKLTLEFPGAPVLCVSQDKFHPELKDAICYHIYACLNKPIDTEELLYWLQCIRKDETGSRGPPSGKR